VVFFSEVGCLIFKSELPISVWNYGDSSVTRFLESGAFRGLAG
jgi:hypothetical protein